MEKQYVYKLITDIKNSYILNAYESDTQICFLTWIFILFD